MFVFSHTLCFFEGISTVLFINNTALDGGAIYSDTNCNIIFQGNTSVTIRKNAASKVGGAIYAVDNSNIAFKNYSILVFTAIKSTAPIFLGRSNITFSQNTIVAFSNNYADSEGIIFLYIILLLQ